MWSAKRTTRASNRSCETIGMNLRLPWGHLKSIERIRWGWRGRPNRNIRQRHCRIFQNKTIILFKPRSGQTMRSFMSDNTDKWSVKLREGRVEDDMASRMKHQGILSSLLPNLTSVMLPGGWELTMKFSKPRTRKRQQKSCWTPRTSTCSRTHSHSAWTMCMISNSCKRYCRAFSSTRQRGLLWVQARANQTIC